MSRLRGSMVALVTPFRDGALDEAALRALARWQIEKGTSGLVPCGTTGEGATVTADEHFRIVRACAEEARGRVPVIAGCGSNDTRKTIENVQRAKEAGADAALVVTPYYNKPTPEGLFRHFEAVAKQGGLPVVLYNVPSRASVDMLADTVARCAKLPEIIGVKEASGNVVRIAEIQAAGIPPDFALLAGADTFQLPSLASGGPPRGEGLRGDGCLRARRQRARGPGCRRHRDHGGNRGCAGQGRRRGDRFHRPFRVAAARVRMCRARHRAGDRHHRVCRRAE